MTQYHVYGLGAALVDTEVEVDDAFLAKANIEKGLMTLVDEARQQEILDLMNHHRVTAKRASGGSAANTVIANSYFGGSSFYSCKVANDENGHFYLQDLQNAGVDSNLHSDKEEGITGKCLVMITPDAERSMNTFLGISETLSTAELNHDALTNSEFLYIEGYLVTSDTGRAAAIEARKVAEKSGVKTALSFSDPGIVEFFRDGIAEILGDGVDLIFCNEAEALHWAQTDDLQKAIESLKIIASSFCITLGAKGAVIYDGEQILDIPAYPTQAIDTNGAGDMFAGAFLYGITQKWSFTRAGKLASLAAANIVSHYGPRLPADNHQHILEEFVAK